MVPLNVKEWNSTIKQLTPVIAISAHFLHHHLVAAIQTDFEWWECYEDELPWRIWLLKVLTAWNGVITLVLFGMTQRTKTFLKSAACDQITRSSQSWGRGDRWDSVTHMYPFSGKLFLPWPGQFHWSGFTCFFEQEWINSEINRPWTLQNVNNLLKL